MRMMELGRSGLKVSELCLGTMTWGTQTSEAEAHALIDLSLEAGINFMDTAELYPVTPISAETTGLTEEIIGTWNAKSGRRADWVIATKIAGAGAGAVRGGEGITKTSLPACIDDSLRRLQTDYIDLYQLHWPTRGSYMFRQNWTYRPNPMPTRQILDDMHMVLDGLDTAVKAGKIRHVGLSNETPWGIMEFTRLADAHGLPRPVSIQNPYNLLNRTFEIGLAEMAIREEVGLLAYSPLAFGALSGKYLNGQQPEGARLTLWKRFGRYTSDKGTAATEKYVQLAKDQGLDPSQMALAYVNSRPVVTSNIIGATSMPQLKANIASATLSLSKDVVKEIDAIHQEITNPCP